MKDFKLQISCIIPSTIALGRQSSFTDVGSSATIYLAICLHFHFYFLVIVLNFQKNFPRWLYCRMTKKSKVDINVMKKKDQKKQQSTVSASIRHSRRIWSPFVCWSSLSSRVLTTFTKSSWSSSPSLPLDVPGQSIILMFNLGQGYRKLPEMESEIPIKVSSSTSLGWICTGFGITWGPA